MFQNILILVTFLCITSLQAQAVDSKLFTVINAECNDNCDPYFYTIGTTSKIGHIVKLSFPSEKRELKPDLVVWNPLDPQRQISVVSTIQRLEWYGGSNDPIRLATLFSFSNRALLKEALLSLPDGGEVEIEFVLYEFDFDKNKYFKQFYTLKKPLKFILSEQSQVYFCADPYYRFKYPVNFLCEMTLLPKEGVEEQEVGLTFSSVGTQFIRKLGGP